ncbi:RNA polymerase sigma-70 factor (ECF subfamily) [Chitinophaga niastensis]|uniref:RNA polymerase sigma-70 factor (ECF subfamily) n=1 Tax=Chitinophaga niastensis TaxID=536980 RepID=A0A2P8HJX8_CHINA|nr:sigma-70 family RNA polymerase sigma factor [Chitinophaga niastensis]PSL46521.1 RNA polymerase sigma-70 factor (ECF subfamily) [Chitinophaga niastensis]
MSDATTYNKELVFTKLYHASRDRLYNYLHSYTQDTHLLQDLMQQSYLKVWERMGDIQDIEKALPLLKTIARNLLIDVIRRRMKEDTAWLETVQEEAHQLITLPAENSRASLQALDTAIAQLPDNCRQVYLLHREEGLSYREISLRMSVSVSMVEKHMSKAIRLLKQELITNGELVLVLVAVHRLL